MQQEINLNKLTECKEIISKHEEKCKILSPNLNFPKILLFGFPRSGKSSLKHILLNKEAEIINILGKKVGLKIDDQVINEELNEPIMNLNEELNLAIYEFSGFEDEKELEQDIIDSSLIGNILQNESDEENKIKILLTVSESDLYANRGTKMTKFFDWISNMFSISEEAKDGLGLIITKCDNDLTSLDYIQQIDSNASKGLKKWSEFFLNNINNVFTFPQASSYDIGKKYEFEDHDRIIQFIQRDYIIKPSYQIVLNESNSSKIESIRENNAHCIEICLMKIFNKFSKNIHKETWDFEEIENCINNLEQSDMSITNDLKRFMQQNFNINDEYNSEFEKIKYYEEIDIMLDILLRQHISELAMQTNFDSITDRISKLLLSQENLMNDHNLNKTSQNEFDQSISPSPRIQSHKQNKSNCITHNTNENKNEEKHQKNNFLSFLKTFCLLI